MHDYYRPPVDRQKLKRCDPVGKMAAESFFKRHGWDAVDNPDDLFEIDQYLYKDGHHVAYNECIMFQSWKGQLPPRTLLIPYKKIAKYSLLPKPVNFTICNHNGSRLFSIGMSKVKQYGRKKMKKFDRDEVEMMMELNPKDFLIRETGYNKELDYEQQEFKY